MVLVINDNLYGLMFALSYICRRCPFALLDLHMLESRLREEKEEEYVLIKAKCALINTQVQVKICRIVLLPSWCMGKRHVNLHQAKRNEEGGAS